MYSKVFQGFNFCLDSGVPQAKKKIYLPDKVATLKNHMLFELKNPTRLK